MFIEDAPALVKPFTEVKREKQRRGVPRADITGIEREEPEVAVAVEIFSSKETVYTMLHELFGESYGRENMTSRPPQCEQNFFFHLFR